MKLNSCFSSSRLGLLLVFVLARPFSAEAATVTWDGSSDGHWTNINNWTGIAQPSADLLFPPGAIRFVTTNSFLSFPRGQQSITLSGSNYFIRGNAIRLTNGLTASYVSGTSTVDADLVVGNDQTYTVTKAAATLLINGDVMASSFALTLQSAGVLRMTGVMSGFGSYTSSGAGRVEWLGASVLTSSIHVQNGTFWVNGSASNATFLAEGGTLGGVGTLNAVTMSGGTLEPGTNSRPGVLTIRGAFSGTAGGTVRLHLNNTTAGSGYSQLVFPNTSSVSLSGATLDPVFALASPPPIGTTFKIIDKAGATPVSGTFNNLPEGANITFNGVVFQISYAGGDGNDVVLTVVDATATWAGLAINNLWSTTSNWANLFLPINGGKVLFPANAGLRATINNLAIPEYNHITFSGSNYSIVGNSLSITNGILCNQPTGTNVIAVPVTLLADQTWNNSAAAAFLTAAAVSVGVNDLRLDGAGSYLIPTFTSGSGLISKFGAGTLYQTGTNTATGPMLLAGGTTVLRAADLASSASLTVSNATLTGTGRVSTVTMKTASSRIEPGDDIGIITVAGNLTTLSGTIAFELNGPTAGVGYDQLVVNGTVNLTNTSLSLALNFTPAIGDSFTLISNDGVDPVAGQFAGFPEGFEFDLASAHCRLTYAGGTGNDVVLQIIPDLKIWDGSALTNNWSIAANWTDNVTPRAGDSLFFPNVVSADTFATNDLPDFTSFGTITFSNADYTVSGNAIEVGTNLTALDNSLTRLNNNLRLRQDETWKCNGSTLTFGGAVNLNGHALALSGTGGSYTFSGPVTNAGSLTMLSPMTVALNGTNTYAGPTTISNSAATLTIGGTLFNNSLVFSGSSLTVAAGALLSNCPVTVSTGFVTVNGTLLRSAMQFNAGTLQGTGTLSTLTCAGGRIEPGSSFQLGILRSSNLTMNAATTLRLELNNATPGTGHDQLKVNGTVNLGGATLILTDNLALTVATFVLIDNDGADAVTGTFAGLPEGAPITLHAANGHITYQGGDGNDVAFIVDSVQSRGVWTGASPFAEWSIPGNWSGNVLPQPGDDLVFPDSSMEKSNHYDFTGARSFNSLNFSGSGYVIQPTGFEIQRTNYLLLANGIFATNAAGLNEIQARLDFGASAVVSNTPGTTLVLSGELGHQISSTFFSTTLPLFSPAGTVRMGRVLAQDTIGVTMLGPGRLILGGGGMGGTHTVGRGTLEATGVDALGLEVSGSSVFRPKVAVADGATFEVSGSETFPNLLTNAGRFRAAATNVTWSGSITLNGTNAVVDVASNASLTISGAIIGTNGFTKDGPGPLVFRGEKGYTGLTTINGGSLFIEGMNSNTVVEVNNNGALSGFGVVGPLTCNSGFVAPGSPTTNAVLIASEGVNLSSSSALRLRLNGTAKTNFDQLLVLGPVILNSARLETVLNFIPPVASTFQVISNDASEAIIGTFAGIPQNGFHTNGQAVFQVSYTGGSGNDVVLTLHHYNVTGVTRVWTGAGADNLWSTPQNWSDNLAPAPGDALIFPSGALQLTNVNDLASNTVFSSVTITGVGYRLVGNAIALVTQLAATNPSSSNTVALPLTLTTQNHLACDSPGAVLQLEGLIDSNDRTAIFSGDGLVRVTGAIVGGGGVDKNGAGVAELRGPNTYAGTTRSITGRLIFNGGGPGASGGGIIASNTGTIELLGVFSVSDGFDISGLLVLSNATPVSLSGGFDFHTNQNGTINVAAGTVVNAFTGFTEDGGGLIKEGAGTLFLHSLNVNSMYFGPTVVNGGTLIVDSTENSGASRMNSIVVNNGATFAGTGVVSTVQCNAGVLAPGFLNGPGRLVLRRGLTLSPASRLDAQLNGVLAGVEFDQVRVEGSVTLNNAALNASVGFNAVFGTPFIIIDNDGADPVSGTFASLPEGATLTVSNVFLQISYVGGDGNDVVLTRVSPPASISSLACVAGGAKKLQGVGLPSVIYIIQATTNITPPAAWQSIGGTTANGAGLFQFTDSDAPNFPIRFYRVQSP